MSVIFEYQPDITDTTKERDELIKDAQQFALDSKEEGDFLVVATDESTNNNELFEESTSVFTVDGKNKEFNYVSSFKNGSTMYSFGQDSLGLWWWFERTGLTNGKNLQGPFTTKDKLIKSMGERYA